MNSALTNQQSFSPSNSVYQVRMSDFCHNYMPQTTTSPEFQGRTERAVSPVNPTCANESFINMSLINNNSPYVNKICSNGLFPLNHHDSGMSSFSQTFNEISQTASPFYPNRTKNIINKNLLHVNESVQFQSTPNKPVVPTYPAQEKSQKRKTNFHSITDLAKSSDSSSIFESNESRDMSSGYLSNVSSTVPSITTTVAPTAAPVTNSISSFNEHFKKFAVDLENNKENETEHEFIYKTKRRPRAQINKQQREILEYAYKLKCYPDANEVEYLCNVLGFEENVIRVSLI